MWGAPSRSSLLRLLLGAVFTVLGWTIASATTASADEQVLTPALSAVGAPVTAAADEVEAAVPATAGAATAVVKKVVAATPVASVAEKPVSALTTSVESTVTAATDAVVTPVVDEVVRPVVDEVVSTVEVVESVEPGAGGALPSAPGALPVPAPAGPSARAAAQPSAPAPGAVRAEDAERTSLSTTPDVAAGSQVAPLFGAAVPDAATEHAPTPSDREPVVPWPGWDLGALAPSSSPSPVLSLSLAVLGMAALLLRPELRCATARPGRQVPAVGPASDPGSRPG